MRYPGVILTVAVCVLTIGVAVAQVWSQDRPGTVVGSFAQSMPVSDENQRWIEFAIPRMQLIKPGMTRGDLLKVFTTEGGISTRLQRTYVKRECKYFKVDVAFQPVRLSVRDTASPITESEQDIIVSISRPYVAFPVLD